ncbi:TetR/AcrR family transcriptional regulator [Flexivirga sp. ID2601S]|uniref:TetR/AcrR family transcriptional regulator n=1 Tax=Flexivirga aerilata TaxID=1656889 RepID=A0A849AIZ7_9MICO|nr:TetR family transcriptional regulator [Flexivirga aerilata]NNG40405.1 TetR/AcrR family transcriptional regulator [Flexivirga aerilata]
MNKSRGRRPGSPQTREEILRAAREAFLTSGYARTPMRRIAAAADVDVALLSYHFGSKQGLFAAAMTLPIRPGDEIEKALDAPIEEWPERILRTVLRVWDHPQAGPAAVHTLLAGASDPVARRALDEFLERELIGRIERHLGGRDAHRRAMGLLVPTAGLLTTRYLLQVPAYAEASHDELVRIVAPSLAIHLRGARAAPRD